LFFFHHPKDVYILNFDLDKLQAAAELGEVIRLQNQALEQLASFRKLRPNLIIPNLAKMVEENLKENVQILYKELNNLHKPQAEQRRHICRICNMAFAVALPGGICDECRSKQAVTPRPAYGAKPEQAEPEPVGSALEETPESITEDRNVAESEQIEKAESAELAQDQSSSPAIDEPEESDGPAVEEPPDDEAPVDEPATEDDSDSAEIKEPPSEDKPEQRS
jgi:hypothetical protein